MQNADGQRDLQQSQEADHGRRYHRDIAWRAQLRLCSRFRRFAARAIPQNKICVAVAPELAAFGWDIARHAPTAH